MADHKGIESRSLDLESALLLRVGRSLLREHK
jgi:hypothetical protein